MTNGWTLEWQDEAGVHSIPLHGQVTVGRAEGNDVVTGGVRMTRRRHLVIRPEGDSVSVDARGSANGLRIAGQTVSSARLSDGQSFAAGGVSFRVRQLGSNERPVPSQPRPYQTAPATSRWVPAATAAGVILLLAVVAFAGRLLSGHQGEGPQDYIPASAVTKHATGTDSVSSPVDPGAQGYTELELAGGKAVYVPPGSLSGETTLTVQSIRPPAIAGYKVRSAMEVDLGGAEVATNIALAFSGGAAESTVLHQTDQGWVEVESFRSGGQTFGIAHSASAFALADRLAVPAVRQNTGACYIAAFTGWNLSLSPLHDAAAIAALPFLDNDLKWALAEFAWTAYSGQSAATPDIDLTGGIQRWLGRMSDGGIDIEALLAFLEGDDRQESRSQVNEINSDPNSAAAAGRQYQAERIAQTNGNTAVTVVTWRHYQWESARDDILEAAREGRKIVLLGHSGGGAAALWVARALESEGLPVELLVEYDTYTGDYIANRPPIVNVHFAGKTFPIRAPEAPEWVTRFQKRLPSNVKSALNYYQQTSGYYHGRPEPNLKNVRNIKIAGDHTQVPQEALASGEPLSAIRGACADGSSSPDPAVASTSTTTVFAIDVSDSMADAHKLEDAKAAANAVLQFIGDDNRANGQAHRVGLVSFSTAAQVEKAVTNDTAAAQSVVTALATSGRTNIVAALRESLDLMPAQASGESQFIVLMTDGAHNEGPANYDALVTEARNRGICIYTLGFGADVKEQELREIADGSGCGAYAFANAEGAGFDLLAQYMKARHRGTGSLVLDTTGTLREGEHRPLGSFTVAPGSGELVATLAWPGSDADLIITDPSGRTVDESYKGRCRDSQAGCVTISRSKSLVSIFVNSPAAGEWTAEVRGIDVPEGTMPFYAAASVRAGNAADLAEARAGFNGAALLVAGGLVLAALLAVGLVVGLAARRTA